MALILTRYPGQRIKIGDDIWVWVGKIDKNRNSATIFVDAPKDVKVNREEVLKRQAKEAE